MTAISICFDMLQNLIVSDIIYRRVMDNIDFLRKLGLGELEAKLYISLLEMGKPISVRHLSERVGLKRTTTYLYIDSLLKKGLIVKAERDTKKEVVAINPKENLKALVDKQLQSIKTIKEQLPIILGQFDFHSHGDIEDTNIITYKGIVNTTKLYRQALDANEVRSYVKLVQIDNIFTDYIAEFTKAFEANKHLVMKEIIYDSSVQISVAQELSKLTDRYSYKIMPKELRFSSEDILIYDEKVAIFNFKEKLNCILIQSGVYYNNSKEIFDYIWNTLPNIHS